MIKNIGLKHKLSHFFLNVAPTYFVWSSGIYITLYLLCLYAHVNEKHIISNNTNGFLLTLSLKKDKSLLNKISELQKMKVISQPHFWNPQSIYLSLLGDRQPLIESINLLKKPITKMKKSIERVNLSEADLSDIDLHEANAYAANFNRADLKGANLSGANLISVQFSETDLREANLSGSNLFNTNISNSLLQSANLNSAIYLSCEQLRSAIIDRKTQLPDYIQLIWSSESDYGCKNHYKGQGINFSDRDLSETKLLRVNLRKANLSRTKFFEADLREAQFNEALLTAANLRGADLRGAKLGGANLKSADLKGANLKGAEGLTCKQIQDAAINRKTQSPDYIHLVWSSESDYNCINLQNGEGINLSDKDLSETKLLRVNLRKANLSRTKFIEADLRFIRFNEALLTAANLRSADLRGAKLGGANLKGANLKGANLKGAEGLTCKQIQDAAIDKNTELPENVKLAWLSNSSFECTNTLEVTTVTQE